MIGCWSGRGGSNEQAWFWASTSPVKSRFGEFLVCKPQFTSLSHPALSFSDAMNDPKCMSRGSRRASERKAPFWLVLPEDGPGQAQPTSRASSRPVTSATAACGLTADQLPHAAAVPLARFTEVSAQETTDHEGLSAQSRWCLNPTTRRMTIANSSLSAGRSV